MGLQQPHRGFGGEGGENAVIPRGADILVCHLKAMRISSRTPEGMPNRCPLCGSDFCIEPSVPPGDATCPSCGNLVWFRQTAAPLPRRRTPSAPVARAIAVDLFVVSIVVVLSAVYAEIFGWRLGLPELLVVIVLAWLLFG